MVIGNQGPVVNCPALPVTFLFVVPTYLTDGVKISISRHKRGKGSVQMSQTSPSTHANHVPIAPQLRHLIITTICLQLARANYQYVLHIAWSWCRQICKLGDWKYELFIFADLAVSTPTQLLLQGTIAKFQLITLRSHHIFKIYSQRLDRCKTPDQLGL